MGNQLECGEDGWWDGLSGDMRWNWKFQKKKKIEKEQKVKIQGVVGVVYNNCHPQQWDISTKIKFINSHQGDTDNVGI